MAPAAYRIVQESLTNVLRHAGAPARPRSRAALDGGAARRGRRPAAGAAAPAGRGSGIAGMRERAESLGGQLEAGPRRRRLPGAGALQLPAVTPIRVVVVDDQALVRMGLRALLETEPDTDLVGEAADGRAGWR